MIKLVMPLDAIKKHLEFFKEKVYSKLKTEKETAEQTDGTSNRTKFWNMCWEKRDIIAVGTPAEIRKVVSKDSEHSEDKLLELFNKCEKEEGNSFRNKVKKVFDYEKFSEKSPSGWDAYGFTSLMKHNVKICPYCNQNYIFTVMRETENETPHGTNENKEKLFRPCIDHFYPQKQYPFLALSLYNMVPCCEVCNLRIKKGKKVPINTLTPYEFSLDENFSFGYGSIFKDKEMANIELIDKIGGDSGTLKTYYELFLTKEIYKYHDDIAYELYKRNEKYGERYFRYFDNLFQKKVGSDGEIKPYEHSEEERIDLLWGKIPEKEDILKISLGKLRKDLINELEEYRMIKNTNLKDNSVHKKDTDKVDDE